MASMTIIPKAAFLNILRVKIHKISRSERHGIDRAEEHVLAYAEALADANIISDNERNEFYELAKQATEDAVRKLRTAEQDR